MNIALIAAMANHRVIGKNNALPWHLPADLKHFKTLTLGKSILMGRKTFESIGKPLPGRQNIILTHDRHFNVPGCVIIHSIETVLSQPSLKTEISHKQSPSGFLHSTDEATLPLIHSNELMIIGGTQIYQQFLPLAHYLYLTIIHADIAGDTFFPEWPAEQWIETAREDHFADEQNKYNYSFLTLEKSPPL